MSTNSSIEWTEVTWNPVVGCTPISPGCDLCYAGVMSHRLAAMGQAAYVGLTVKRKAPARAGGRERATFNGTVRTLPDRLADPLGWRKPRRVFVNSMSDLFHKDVPFEFIDRVFAVMALAPQHTFQVLTKRPERMAEYLADSIAQRRVARVAEAASRIDTTPYRYQGIVEGSWPLPNVWLGTSVENQDAADERIPHLLRCPAAVRFLSCEPLLGPIDLSAYFGGPYVGLPGDKVHPNYNFGIGWVIVGGESGPGARPCDVAWIRSVVAQCKAAGTACFVKQVGSKPRGFAQWHHPDNDGHGIDIGGETGRKLTDKKGGDPAEWPEDLQVREMPEGA